MALPRLHAGVRIWAAAVEETSGNVVQTDSRRAPQGVSEIAVLLGSRSVFETLRSRALSPSLTRLRSKSRRTNAERCYLPCKGLSGRILAGGLLSVPLEAILGG